MTANTSELVVQSTDYDHGPAICVTTRRQNIPIEELQPNQVWLQGWDGEAMQLSQLAGPMIGLFLAWMEEGKSWPTWQEISHLSDDFKSLWAQWEQLELLNGLFFRRPFLDRTRKCMLQLLVPQTKQWEVFEHLHDHSTGGHMGAEKTWEDLICLFRARFAENSERLVQEMWSVCCMKAKSTITAVLDRQSNWEVCSGHTGAIAKNCQREKPCHGPGWLLHKVDGSLCCA